MPWHPGLPLPSELKAAPTAYVHRQGQQGKEDSSSAKIAQRCSFASELVCQSLSCVPLAAHGLTGRHSPSKHFLGAQG